MKNMSKIIIFVVIVLAVFFGVTKFTADKTYRDRVAAENYSQPDTYKMQEFCAENADIILQALKDGDTGTIEASMINPTNIDDLLNFADWSKLNLEKKTSFGSGSYMTTADENGRMDVGELFVVKAGNDKYVIYIQTVVSRWGKINDGVSCIATTKFQHYDDVDYSWEWQTETKNTARAGEPFGNK